MGVPPMNGLDFYDGVINVFYLAIVDSLFS